jgi:glucose-6-phosphate isomerase
LLVSCIGAFLQINTYDQPGVEYGKIILKEKLQKSS